MRAQSEIDAQMNKASDAIEKGTTNWPGMTYEDGVSAALSWVSGLDIPPPMDN